MPRFPNRPNLVRYVSNANYYGRFKFDGKLIRERLLNLAQRRSQIQRDHFRPVFRAVGAVVPDVELVRYGLRREQTGELLGAAEEEVRLPGREHDFQPPQVLKAARIFEIGQVLGGHVEIDVTDGCRPAISISDFGFNLP